jgi:secreted trypsin-like serine protease
MIATGLVLASLQPVAAIVYGQPTGAAFGNVGSMVEVRGQDTLQWCSGTLIRDGHGDGSNRGVFLTAAHCTAAIEEEGLTLADIRITFASDGVSDLIPVTGLYQHPKYGHKQSNPYDIAVLYFDEQTAETPATLAGDGYLSALGQQGLRTQTFTTVGYGVVRGEKTGGFKAIDWESMDRHYATQHVQSIERAWLTLAMNDRNEKNGGTCYGDSGGPHFHQAGAGLVLVALTVTGDAVCKAADKTYRIDTPWAAAFLEDALGS